VSLSAGVTVEKKRRLRRAGRRRHPAAEEPVAQPRREEVQIRTDVSAGGTKLDTLKVDPVLLGIGVGWRF